MARGNMAEEARTRREMTDAYKRQKDGPDGFDDWGRFTAHVVCTQRQEMERLRALLEEHGINAGSWDGPFEVQEFRRPQWSYRVPMVLQEPFSSCSTRARSCHVGRVAWSGAIFSPGPMRTSLSKATPNI